MHRALKSLLREHLNECELHVHGHGTPTENPDCTSWTNLERRDRNMNEACRKYLILKLSTFTRTKDAKCVFNSWYHRHVFILPVLNNRMDSPYTCANLKASVVYQRLQYLMNKSRRWIEINFIWQPLTWRAIVTSVTCDRHLRRVGVATSHST